MVEEAAGDVPPVRRHTDEFDVLPPEPEQPERPEWLTPAEHEAVRLMEHLYYHVTTHVIGNDPRARTLDVNEFARLLQQMERMIIANMAARAYGGRYRLLGELSPDMTGSAP